MKEKSREAEAFFAGRRPGSRGLKGVPASWRRKESNGHMGNASVKGTRMTCKGCTSPLSEMKRITSLRTG